MVAKTDLKRKSPEDEISKKKRKRIRKENAITNDINKISKNENSKKYNENYDENVETSFSLLEDKISENTLKAIDNMGFKSMEKKQEHCILSILQGENLVATLKTKSTSNLTFLIPAVELINNTSAKLRKGTGCIIVSSTRESALQVFGTLKELLQFHEYKCCLLIDGSDYKTEAKKLSRDVNIIVTTVEKLFYHLQNTPDFVYKNLQILILDEIDRILETGCEYTLKQIIHILPENRQTALFMREKINVDELVNLTMNKKPIYLDQVERSVEKIVDGLEEGYILAPSDKRFHFLLSFLEKNKKKKVIVLFSSCLSTIHHHDLLTSLDVPVFSIHSKQKQLKRMAIFSKFSTSSGILLCAEATASEFVFPKVDWILQYDPPENPKEHINRLSEMIKDSKGKSVLILSPEEIGFLFYLKEAGVSTSEFKISWNKIKNIQLSLEKLMAENYFLNLSGKEAFKAFVKSYDSHHLKEIFNIEKLDLTKVAKSFGFTVPPAVDLSITEFDKSARPEKRLGGGGYGFFKTLNRTNEKKGKKIFKQVGKRKKNSKADS